jgi:hypothetical protein
MSGIYGMRRANGDWFALQTHERLRVPLFHNSHDAMMARLRNFGMLLFHPVALNPHLLNEMVPAGGASDVDFYMVNDPLVSLDRGNPLGQLDIVLLMNKSAGPSTVSDNGNGRQDSNHVSPLQNEWWD